MSKVDFTGLGVALVTPFKTDESVDYEALGGLLQFHVANGTDYIVALGTTAETVTLTEEEQAEVVRFVVKTIAGRIPIVVGAGGNCTRTLIEKIKKMDFTGVCAILSVTPYYNKPSQEGLYQHYCKLNEASPVPVIMYNVPGRTGVNMTAETTLRIARECDNIVATKEASGDLSQIKEIIAGAPEGFQVISGDDSMTTDLILSGGVGVISVFGNAYPKEMKWLVDSALSGSGAEARKKMEADFDKLFDLMFIDGNPSGVKALMNMRGMLENVLRLPLVPVRKETEEKILDEFKRFS